MFIGRSAHPITSFRRTGLQLECYCSKHSPLLRTEPDEFFASRSNKHVTPDGVKPVDSLRTNDVETTVTVWTETIHLMLRLQPTRLQPVSSATVSPAAVPDEPSADSSPDKRLTRPLPITKTGPKRLPARDTPSPAPRLKSHKPPKCP